MEPAPERIDDQTWAVYLQVPAPQVVQLQAYFENYEGAGTVRTIDIQRSLIAVLTTSSMLGACLEILQALRAEIPWLPGRPVPGAEAV